MSMQRSLNIHSLHVSSFGSFGFQHHCKNLPSLKEHQCDEKKSKSWTRSCVSATSLLQTEFVSSLSEPQSSSNTMAKAQRSLMFQSSRGELFLVDNHFSRNQNTKVDGDIKCTGFHFGNYLKSRQEIKPNSWQVIDSSWRVSMTCSNSTHSFLCANSQWMFGSPSRKNWDCRSLTVFSNNFWTHSSDTWNQWEPRKEDQV